MASDAGRVRLERFKVDVAYHAAFSFWNFKGLLAERYGHGPKFGAYADLGNAVRLTPKGGFAKDPAEVTYGLTSSSFDQEQVPDPGKTYAEAKAWFGDVMQVLDPKRLTGVAVHWFALHPVGSSANADAALSKSDKLRRYYYDKDRLDQFLPAGYDRRFCAIDGLCIEGDKKWSAIMGAVGPPHKNQFFGVPDPERDSKWWMGLNFTMTRTSEDGLGSSGAFPRTIDELIDDGAEEYERLVTQELIRVV